MNFFLSFLFWMGEYKFPNEACERPTIPLVLFDSTMQVTASWCRFSGSNSAVLEQSWLPPCSKLVQRDMKQLKIQPAKRFSESARVQSRKMQSENHPCAVMKVFRGPADPAAPRVREGMKRLYLFFV